MVPLEPRGSPMTDARYRAALRMLALAWALALLAVNAVALYFAR